MAEFTHNYQGLYFSIRKSNQLEGIPIVDIIRPGKSFPSFNTVAEVGDEHCI